MALDLTARATPDGHTLLVGNNTSNGIVPVLFAARMRSDPHRELTGITLMAEIQHVLIAAAKFPPNTYPELVEYIRARPGASSYSAPLSGHPHLIKGEPGTRTVAASARVFRRAPALRVSQPSI